MTATPNQRSTRSRPPIPFVALVATVAALCLPACGASSKAPSADAGDREGTTTAAPRDAAGGGECGAPLPAAPEASTSFPLTVTDDRGVDVELAAPAKRVVTLEWSYTEYVLALGLQPVGAADIANYAGFVTDDPPIGPDVTDLGSRSQPSIETIRTLAPDLILTDTNRAAASMAELEAIAPVLAFDTYGTGVDQLAQMLTSFRTVAGAVDRSEEAERVVGDLATTLTTVRDRLAAADLPTTRFALVQGEGTVEAPLFRLFTDSSMVAQLVAHLCLDNAVEGDSDGATGEPLDYGYLLVSMDGLTKLGDAWFLPVAPSSAVEEFQERFADNALYTSMPFVVADRVRVLPENTWFFGGPISAMLLVERVADAVTS